MSKLIYLDNAATTQVYPEVLDEMLPYFTEHYGNPAAIYSFAGESEQAVAKARKQVADVIGAKTDEIYFTGGGSESDNWALKATAEAYAPKGKHIITTAIEHHAILHTAQWLEQHGYEITYVGVDENGTVKLDELEAAMKQEGVKALILCNPSNPCGKVFTRQELMVIADLAKKYDIYVITDEVYEHILYEPNKHTYMASLPGMRERTIMCNSLSKTYSITGWRLGYVIASPEIIDRVKKVHDFLTVGAAAPLMEACVVGLKFGDEYYRELKAHYTHMKNLFVGGLRDIGLQFTEPQGAYYVLVDISEFGYENDYLFCEDLARKVGVGAVPGSSFFRENVNHLIRVHFAKQDETLNAALDRLADIRRKMK